jgi:hypothetical protein
MDDNPIREAHRQTIYGLLALIPSTLPSVSKETSSENLIWMMKHCLENIDVFPIDKIGRWVGFVQGVLAGSGHLDVIKERERTRPFFHDAYAETGLVIPKTASMPN